MCQMIDIITDEHLLYVQIFTYCHERNFVLFTRKVSEGMIQYKYYSEQH
jgi:hypothetical protein